MCFQVAGLAFESPAARSARHTLRAAAPAVSHQYDVHHPRRLCAQMMCQGDEYGGSDGKHRPFPVTLEEVYGAIAQYYDISWLSYRNAGRQAAGWMVVGADERQQPPGHVLRSSTGIAPPLTLWSAAHRQCGTTPWRQRTRPSGSRPS